MELDQRHVHSVPELLLYSLGFGPIGTSLLLYYLLLIMPHRADIFYISFVFAVYLLLLVLGRRQWARAYKEIKSCLDTTLNRYRKSNSGAKLEYGLFAILLIAFLSVFLFVFLKYTVKLPLYESDALKYAQMGKICFQEKSLEYRWVRYYRGNGSMSPDIHSAPSYALLLTWEKMTGGLVKSDQDIYYKTVSAYYSLLILGIVIYWLSKRNKLLALLGGFALLSGFAFFITLFQQHLDSYRTFFVIISWIFLAYAVEKTDRLSFLLFGVSSGFAAYAHTSGAIMALINAIVYMVFVKGTWKYRIRKTYFLLTIIFIFGLIHYVLDVFWGRGWVLFYRPVTFWG
jgi:hypothetical protein